MPQISETQMAVATPDEVRLGSVASMDESGVTADPVLTFVFEDGEFSVRIPLSNFDELLEGMIEMAYHLGA